MVAGYSCKRKTKRWPIVVFSTIIDLSALNGFVIYNQINPNWFSSNISKRNLRRHFLEILGKELIKPYIQQRQGIPRNMVSQKIIANLKALNYKPGTSNGVPLPNHAFERPRKRGRCTRCYKEHVDQKKKKFNILTDTCCITCRANTCKKHSVVVCHQCFMN